MPMPRAHLYAPTQNFALRLIDKLERCSDSVKDQGALWGRTVFVRLGSGLPCKRLSPFTVAIRRRIQPNVAPPSFLRGRR